MISCLSKNLILLFCIFIMNAKCSHWDFENLPNKFSSTNNQLNNLPVSEFEASLNPMTLQIAETTKSPLKMHVWRFVNPPCNLQIAGTPNTSPSQVTKTTSTSTLQVAETTSTPPLQVAETTKIPLRVDGWRSLSPYLNTQVPGTTSTSTPQVTETTKSPLKVHVWRTLSPYFNPPVARTTNTSPPPVTSGTPTLQVAVTTKSPLKVYNYHFLKPVPSQLAETSQSPNNIQMLDPFNWQQPIQKPEIHFPKEDASQPSLHKYHPEDTFTKTTPNTRSYGQAAQKFNKKLFDVLAPQYAHKNLIYSPSSLQTILSLLYFGAEGQTAAELHCGLEIDPTDAAKFIQKSLATTNSEPMSDDFKFQIANKIYYKNDLTLEPNFKKTALKSFYSDLESINFDSKELAANKINQWVSDKTDARIEHIIDAETLDAQTQTILVNAIYLKAKWAHQFSMSDTDKMSFYTRNDLKHAKSVDMMYTEDDFNYGDFPALNASIVELPFRNNELSMLIIVPNAIDGLRDVEHRLKDANLNELVSKMEFKKLTLRMPKFKIEAEIDMMVPLEKLGIRNIFTTKAEFGKIFSNNPYVQISKMLHKAYIKVNEGGVEAAAATYSQITPLSINPNMVYLTVDHPFMFAIRSKEAVHIMGHVIDDFQ